MKYKFNETLSALGMVFEAGKEYEKKEVPMQFMDAWIASGHVEVVEEE